MKTLLESITAVLLLAFIILGCEKNPLSEGKEITDFVFKTIDNNGLSADVHPEEISENKITLAVPYETDVTRLRPTISITGVFVSPISGTPNNFTYEPIYTVTAEDGSVKHYTIIVVPKPFFNILSYHVKGNRIGAGDFETVNLFEISGIEVDGTYNYTLKIADKEEWNGSLEIVGGKAIITNRLSVEDWNSIPEGEITIVLTIADEQFNYSITKEQYKIKSWQDLQGMKYDLEGDYILENDISLPDPSITDGDFPEELPAEGFDPVGDFNDRFTGSFDGGNYVISNFFINRDKAYVGLFGCSNGATIKNVGIETSAGGVMGKFHVGGLVGWDDWGTITNSYVAGSVTGDTFNIGGLVGYIRNGTITNSYATSSVTSMKNGENVGGLVGSGNTEVAITNSYATGSVTGGDKAGGLVGYGAVVAIANSYATGSVEGNQYVGGLVGYGAVVAIANSYATGSVTGGNDVGGLVGLSNGTITASYATGNVTGANAGGLVGNNNYTIIANSYWDKASTEQDDSDGDGGTGVSSGANLKQEGDKYIDKEEDGTGTDEVFVDWKFGTDDDNPWKWLGEGKWPILHWAK